MNPAINKYELFIFHYAPRLRIVGAYHALNDQDRETLEHLVSKSDFVALEIDQHRLEEKNPMKLLVEPGRQETSLDNEGRILTGLFNGLYIHYLYNYLASAVSLSNERLAVATGKEIRDKSQGEFEYCYRIAQQQQKDVYVVDLRIEEMFARIARLPLNIRLRHFSKLLLRRKNSFVFSPAVDKIINGDRETHMIQRIEEEEGCSIQDLQRQGLLVVGMTHALNYYSSIPSRGF